MSSTSTTRLGLIKPTPGTGEPVNVQTQINDSWEMIDYAIGTTLCTTVSHPASPFHGQLIQETDTDSVFYHNGASPASGGWVRILTENDTSVTVCTSSTRPGSPSDGDMILETDTEQTHMYNGGSWRQIFMDGARAEMILPGGGSNAGLRLYTSSTSQFNRAIGTRGSTDSADERWCLDYDGGMQWGPGTDVMDVNLYWGGPGWLQTDGQIINSGVSWINRTTDVAVATTTETIVLTSASYTFKAGLAYEVEFFAPCYGSVAGLLGLFRLRKGTTTGGADWGEYGRWRVESGASNVIAVQAKRYLVRTAGTDLTSEVTATVTGTVAGTYTVRGTITTSRPHLLIKPVGLASEYSGLGVTIT